MYLSRNVEARNHGCSGIVISVSYSKCVFVGLANQHAMRMIRNAICGLPRSTIFFHVVS